MLSTVVAFTLLSALVRAGDTGLGYFVTPITDSSGTGPSPPYGLGSFAPIIDTPYGRVSVYPVDRDTSNAWDRGKFVVPPTTEYVLKTSKAIAALGAEEAWSTCATVCSAIFVPPIPGVGVTPPRGGAAGGGGAVTGGGGGPSGGGSPSGGGDPSGGGGGGQPSGGDQGAGGAPQGGNEPNVQTGGDPNGGSGGAANPNPNPNGGNGNNGGGQRGGNRRPYRQ
ncbi:uncharacterized protein LOC62_01G001766 [Vanrija pseudolonga]|uniref:Uncharacterized protein n=1 Tax=Vanrija pseudolonga TaxID=143232 RepID=A0AAF0Y4Q1_9TREE|nr:hypothetical protein LOC62_01G001766 [Vanrija pseudolonga]